MIRSSCHRPSREADTARDPYPSQACIDASPGQKNSAKNKQGVYRDDFGQSHDHSTKPRSASSPGLLSLLAPGASVARQCPGADEPARTAYNERQQRSTPIGYPRSPDSQGQNRTGGSYGRHRHGYEARRVVEGTNKRSVVGVRRRLAGVGPRRFRLDRKSVV